MARGMTAHLTEFPPEATAAGPGVAAVGPHPLESDDVRFWHGDEADLPDGVEATGGEHVGDGPADPNLAAPGPHPHQSADIEDWGGRTTALPRGVEPYTG